MPSPHPTMQDINHNESSLPPSKDGQQNQANACVNNDNHYISGSNKCRSSKRHNKKQKQENIATLIGFKRRCGRHLPLIAIVVLIIKLSLLLLLLILTCSVQYGLAGSSSSSGGTRMVRLCIASVDPAKLSSQCVMCNRRDFPLTVIDCTGITKVNDLIANPLSVMEATCLIYNCRRQVPDIKPEPYHGSVSHAANYHRGSATGGGGGGGPASGLNGYPITASGSQLYEMNPTSGMLATGYNSMASDGSGAPYSGLGPLLGSPGSPSAYMSRYGLAGFRANHHMQGIGTALAPISSMVPRGLIGGPSLMPYRQHQQQHQQYNQQALPYALVPAPSTFPFGSRKYKAALVPLFK